jgi:hypothetical protein
MMQNARARAMPPSFYYTVAVRSTFLRGMVAQFETDRPQPCSLTGNDIISRRPHLACRARRGSAFHERNGAMACKANLKERTQPFRLGVFGK